MFFQKSMVVGEMTSVTKRLPQKGSCTKNDKHLVMGKADTVPAHHELASGHQLSHPLAMFDSILPIYMCLNSSPSPLRPSPPGLLLLFC